MAMVTTSEPSENNHLTAQTRCLKERDWEGALRHVEPALRQNPDSKEVVLKGAFIAYMNLGIQCNEKQAFTESLQYLEKAKNISPTNFQLMNHIGNVYSNMNDFSRARHFFSRAIAYKPDFIMGYVNLAYVSHRLADHIREDELTDYILKVEPENMMANWHHALWCLLRGDYLRGWEYYKWRFKHPIFISQNKTGMDLDDAFFKKYWTGQKMEDKTLMVFSEQGYGDFIQFCRYIPLLKKRKIKVHVACLKELVPLIRHWRCIESVQVIGGDYPKYHKHVYLLSLPGIFKTTEKTIPKKTPYITVPKALNDKWKKQLPASKNLKVGICCTGNQRTSVAMIRSCQMQDFKPIFELPGIDFYSLHVKDKPRDLGDYPLIDITDGIDDFIDSAAFIKNLDLVISIETAVAHLAGAVGTPVYIVLAKTPAWRWLLDRDDCPWYPTARLFRQVNDREWTLPIQKVIEALKTEHKIG